MFAFVDDHSRLLTGYRFGHAESRMDFTTAVDRLKGELRSLFSSFQYGDDNQLAFFPAELRTPIMHAGRTQTLLRLTYDRVQRLVEPYSLAFK